MCFVFATVGDEPLKHWRSTAEQTRTPTGQNRRKSKKSKPVIPEIGPSQTFPLSRSPPHSLAPPHPLSFALSLRSYPSLCPSLPAERTKLRFLLTWLWVLMPNACLNNVAGRFSSSGTCGRSTRWPFGSSTRERHRLCPCSDPRYADRSCDTRRTDDRSPLGDLDLSGKICMV